MGPTRALISHKNLRHNFNLIRNAVVPAKIMAVVKANAYGHGSTEVAQTLIEAGADFLGVAFAEEGIQLRRAGIRTPILVFGAQLPDFFEDHLEHDLDITLTSADQVQPLKALCDRRQKKARIHIKADTGMGRVGFRPDEQLPSILSLFSEPCFDVVGVYSHLSSSDEDDLTYTRKQIDRFQQLRQAILNHSPARPLFHLANSGAIMRLPESYFDMVRPGIMLYGHAPGPEFNLTWDLKEVMRFVSRVGLVKNIPPGEPLSYSRRYHTSRQTKIAIIPAGYADGINRRATNRGQVLIRGRRYNISGTVCMDQIVVDLGPDSDVQAGDEVVFYGRQGDDMISVMEVSRMLETIPYETTCWVSGRVPRVHIKE